MKEEECVEGDGTLMKSAKKMMMVARTTRLAQREIAR